MNRRTACLLFCAASAAAPTTGAWAGSRHAGEGPIAWILRKDGSSIEGAVGFKSLTFRVGGRERTVERGKLRSFHSADAATPGEAAKISSGLTAVGGKDRKASEAAVAQLTDLGLLVLTPLFKTYGEVDRDGRQPDPLYHLFARIIPPHADAPDRSLDLVRLANGEAFRGKLGSASLEVKTAAGAVTVPAADIRRLALRQPVVEKSFELHSLRHCTYLEWLDTASR